MKRDRLSIHISDSAEIAVEERRNGIKRIKNISIPLCLQGQELRGAVLIRAHGGRA